MPLPPGLVLLVQYLLPRALVPPALAYTFFKVGQSLLGIEWPTWAWIAVVTLVHPTIWIISRIYTSLSLERDAESRGAVLPPQVKGSSLELVKEIKTRIESGYMGEAALVWHQQYGNTFLAKIFGQPRIFTIEPEHLKVRYRHRSFVSNQALVSVLYPQAILATQFDDFWKGPVEEEHFGSLLGSGVFNSDGEMWKFHRNMTRPFFSKVRISEFDLFERHAEANVTAMAERLAAGYPVDFQDSVARFTLDSATEFLFGKDVNSISAGLPYPEASSLASSSDFLNHPSIKFVKAMYEGQEVIAHRGSFGRFWKFTEFWKDKALEHRAAVEEFVAPILDIALENRKNAAASGETKEVKEETFLEHLVTFTEDRTLVMDELLNILLAARDTTAGLLTFAVYVLTQRPDIVARLKAEISERVGNSKPTYEDTRDMKYLRAFLNEVLRLYPSVPFDVRTSKHATTLPNKNGRPFYIPPDARCVYSVFLMHRREDLWGPDALEFDPDRFLDHRLHKYLTPNPFIFLPFNAGPRICLGQQFAYNEASYFMIKLLQKFSDFDLALDVQPSQPPKEWVPASGTTKGRDKVTLKGHLTMYVKGGLWVRMKSATESEDKST